MNYPGGDVTVAVLGVPFRVDIVIISILPCVGVC